MIFRDPTAVSADDSNYVNLCDRDRMYFNGAMGSTFETFIHRISGDPAASELDHAFVFDVLYVLVKGDEFYVWKMSGPYDNLIYEDIYYIPDASTFFAANPTDAQTWSTYGII